jgi:protein-S-isoprenylcysteine O-methyltransferase Ste14
VFNILKTAVFATLFMGFMLVYVPLRWILARGTEVSMPLGLIGVLPLALGLGVTLWCVWEFATRGQGTPAVFDPPKKLVTRGLYSYVRNPMYIGATLLLIGLGILFASRAILIYALAFLVITHTVVVLYEEWALSRKFGGDYLAYKQAVPRWIPRVGPRASA